jgi:hypothetical protein
MMWFRGIHKWDSTHNRGYETHLSLQNCFLPRLYRWFTSFEIKATKLKSFKAFKKLKRLNCMKSFNEILLESVDEAFLKMGRETKHTILFYLEKLYNVDRDAIVKNPRLFEKALDSMFRDGSWIVKKLIIETLYSKIGVNKPVKVEELVDLIEDARIEYEKQQALKFKRLR